MPPGSRQAWTTLRRPADSSSLTTCPRRATATTDHPRPRHDADRSTPLLRDLTLTNCSTPPAMGEFFEHWWGNYLTRDTSGRDIFFGGAEDGRQRHERRREGGRRPRAEHSTRVLQTHLDALLDEPLDVVATVGPAGDTDALTRCQRILRLEKVVSVAVTAWFHRDARHRTRGFPDSARRGPHQPFKRRSRRVYGSIDTAAASPAPASVIGQGVRRSGLDRSEASVPPGPPCHQALSSARRHGLASAVGSSASRGQRECVCASSRQSGEAVVEAGQAYIANRDDQRSHLLDTWRPDPLQYE